MPDSSSSRPVGAQRIRYLVTGGCGFIGSHLVEALLSQGHDVVVYDDLSTGRRENLDAIAQNPGLTVVEGSIADLNHLKDVTAGCDAVVHLAAAVGVKLIVDRPVHVIRTNVGGTDNVLQAAALHGCRVVAASTSEVYGKSRKYPFHEDDEMVLGNKSRWGYAASKAVDEFLAMAYRQEFGLEVGMLRLFNTIGPRQSSEYGMVVPRFVRQALRGQPITVYGDGMQKRCFCDVSDVISAFAALSQKPDALKGVYNVGGSEEVSIQELAERIKVLTNSSSPVRLQTYEQAYGEGFEDVPRRVPDTSRLRAAIGWQPRRNLAQSLDRIIEFERGCMDGGNAISHTETAQALEQASTGP